MRNLDSNMKGGAYSRRRFLKTFLHAWKKRLAAAQQQQQAGAGAGWAHLVDEGAVVPRDVPRGHTVVYVGDELRRHVVRVSCLDHPLFRELLDRARDEYDFAGAGARLRIPCDEDSFLGVLCHVHADRERRKLALCS